MPALALSLNCMEYLKRASCPEVLRSNGGSGGKEGVGSACGAVGALAPHPNRMALTSRFDTLDGSVARYLPGWTACLPGAVQLAAPAGRV